MQAVNDTNELDVLKNIELFIILKALQKLVIYNVTSRFLFFYQDYIVIPIQVFTGNTVSINLSNLKIGEIAPKTYFKMSMMMKIM